MSAARAEPRTAVVTGVPPAWGLAVARRRAEEGASVAVLDLDRAPAETAAAANGGRTIT